MIHQKRTHGLPSSRLVSLLLLVLSIFLFHTCLGYSLLLTTQTNASNRRRLFIDTAVTLVSTFTTAVPPPASAATTTTTTTTITTSSDHQNPDRVQIGHARIQYLLDHWEEITSVCGTTIMSDIERRQVIRTENGYQCIKTPLRVQDYMGYKSTTDPLYRIDKYLLASSTIRSNNVDPNELVDYLDAVEAYKEKADQTAMLAYTSSWGEANPNGSKETIDAYLDQTKTFVVESEKQLRRILGYLHLEPLPPLQKA